MPITNYYWDVDTDNVVLEEDENGNTIAEYTQEPSLYGELIAQERDGQASFYNFDGQGSTRELTDQNQNVTDTYTYDAFGSEVSRTGTTSNTFGYKGALGYNTNPQSNDSYVRERTLQPNAGRWLSLDPIGFVDGPNQYLFVLNDPVNFFDPTGLKCIVCKWERYMGTGPSLATMDNWFVAPPTGVSDTVAWLWNATWNKPNERQKFNALPPVPTTIGSIPPFVNTRAYGKIKKGEETFYGHLFAITADVCEIPPGHCLVDVDENVKSEIKIKSGPWQVDSTVVRPTKTITPTGGNSGIFIGTLKMPMDRRCKKRIVVVDFPLRSQFLKVPVLRQVTVLQKISIYDSEDPSNKYWAAQRFAQGADSFGKQKFNWQSAKSTTGDPSGCC